MTILIAALFIISVILMSLALGGRGSLRNQLASVSFLLLIVTAVLAFLEWGWLWAVGLFIGCWLLGSVGGTIIGASRGGRHL